MPSSRCSGPCRMVTFWTLEKVIVRSWTFHTPSRMRRLRSVITYQR